VSEHAETLLEQARLEHARGLPRYVEEELRRYVKCGVLACGFSRARCRSCGGDLIVAFSCKVRGICPSCTTRRMVEVAAHLADHVLPDVPVRQWVLTVPFELRLMLARDPDLLGAVSRIFVDEITRWRVNQLPDEPGRDRATGGVMFVQRFGSALNLNVHFHLVALDGAYRLGTGVLLGEEPPRFVPSRPPVPQEMASVCDRIRRRVHRLLERRRLVPNGDDAADASPEGEEGQGALDACLRVSLWPDARGAEAPSRRARSRRPPPPLGAELDGFNLDASVRIGQGDAKGRERLCRYAARPPLNLARLSRRPDGRLAYAVRRPQRVLVMTPLEFLGRLCALIPPPYYPLVRYHGVLAPASPWRSSIVPVSTGPKARLRARLAAGDGASGAASAVLAETMRPPDPPRSVEKGPSPPALAVTAAVVWASLGARRLSRYEWAQLLRRVFDLDALRCPSCDGRLAFIAVLTDTRQGGPVTAILEHLGLPADPPRFARARDPTPDPGLDPVTQPNSTDGVDPQPRLDFPDT
jgi:hypothetical protein